MADRWMDDRDRDWRERDWRRSEAYGRGGSERGRPSEAGRFAEERSWADAADEDAERYRRQGRRPLRSEDEPDYGGRSSVASGGVAYGYRGPDDQGYARSYRADRDRDERRGWRPEGGGYDLEFERRYPEDLRRSRAGAGGGYGYERGYGDVSRGEQARREGWDDRREGSGDFLQRAGERISSWFRGDHPMRGSGDEPRRFGEGYRREDRGHRGHGPKGYRRSDERISEEVHDRLTEDPWLDASDVEVAVKDGEVTLSGHVESREGKHHAERLVEDLSGVRHVQNNLRVDPSAGFTGAGRGFGSSALEAEMRRSELAASPSNNGASGRSGRTSTGAAAERPTDPGAKPS